MLAEERLRATAADEEMAIVETTLTTDFWTLFVLLLLAALAVIAVMTVVSETLLDKVSRLWAAVRTRRYTQGRHHQLHHGHR
ncbi:MULTISPECIES: hypothetical protein [Streptomyces]|uniref:hypothetical protein n=1 Tax=Streptomyces TaxID=1883 RepID=UPI0018E0095E|nr:MULTISPECIES: hypothetical protein [Streptomyces]MCZ4102149.1 hypothetical protein [Streptomyces sp. H39-C1]